VLQVEPYFNETGSNCPSILPRQQQKELLELSVNSVKVRVLVFSGLNHYTIGRPRISNRGKG
jgi:carnosine synthase